MVIHLLLHVDGLLQRFGRVAPDAVALLGAVDGLRNRLASSPAPLFIEAHAIRFGPSSPDADRDLEILLGELGHGFDAEHRHLIQTAEALGSIVPLGELVLLTASRGVFKQAWAAKLDVYLVGFDAPEPSRSLAFDEVARMLEEKLRIPTARPMSRTVRTGGLLSMTCQDPGQARHRALEAMSEDPQADWLVLGSTLILYTEEPDYEDRLAVLPEVKRLSYGVHKEALRLERRIGAEGLFVGEGFVLTENEPAGASALTWESVRHRSLSAGARSRDDDLPIAGLMAGPDFAASRDRYMQWLADRSGTSWDLIQEIVGPSACFDLLEENGEAVAAAWQSSSTNPERDEIRVLIHTDHHFGKDLDSSREAVANALAIWRALEGSASRSTLHGRTLHCIRSSELMSEQELRSAFLLRSERAVQS